ncbi:hypothetical protein EC919_10357 [Pseudomonas graminis]|nr:hypothetical protein EC919_10357 [Pseudomonas graminis]
MIGKGIHEMQTIGNYVLRSLAVITMMVASVTVQAAYPKNIQLNIEMWNQSGIDLALVSASWAPANADYTGYGFAADAPTASVSIPLKNPRNDSASFRVSGEGKVCEFTAAHSVTFSWVSITPAPEKSATGRSIGKVPAECIASVTKGTNSMQAYSVRFVMK